MTFLEDNFEVTVGNMEMLPKDLDSIERINTFVERKRAIGRKAAV